MDVVLIAPGHPPTVGGVETHVGALARGLSGLGVHVEVWVPDRAVTSVVGEEDAGVLVRRFPSSRSTRFPVAPRLFLHARRRLHPRTTVHVHGYHNVAAAAVLVAPEPVPFVFTPHFHGGGHTRLASAAHVGYRPVGARLFTRASAVIAVSRAEAALIADRHPSVRPHVVHNGADVAGITSAAAVPGQPPTVLVLGRLEAYKRVDQVIEAFGRVQAAGQLVVVGEGSDRERLTALASRTARAGDIRFLGLLPGAEVHRWLRTATCLVSLSEREAFGLVALEAAVGGATAVLSDIPAHREVAALLPTGVVELSAGAPADVAGRLDRLLARQRDVARQLRDWATVAEEHMAIYLDRARTGDS